MLKGNFLSVILEENKCHPNPCRNGGICTEANGAYICTCMEGYKGMNCEGAIHAQIGSYMRLFILSFI